MTTEAQIKRYNRYKVLMAKGKIYSIPNKIHKISNLGYRHASQRGVHHVIRTQGRVTYSIIWQGRNKCYKVFWPWPSHYQPQETRKFKTENELRQFFKDLQQT